MNALLFLSVKKAKNKIAELKRKPSELITVIIFLLLFVTSFSSPSAFSDTRDCSELFAIAFAVYTLIFILISRKGFSNGASMFSMADVNLLFTSPSNENTVLFYGLFQQLTKFFSLSFVLLFHTNNIRNIYNVKSSVVFALFIGYCLTGLLAQMTSMLIYRFACADEKLKRIFKSAYTAVIAVFFVFYVLTVINNGLSADSLVKASESHFLKLFPVSAPIIYGIKSIFDRNIITLIISVVYITAYCGVFILILTRSKRSYYEDVLKASELNFSAIASQKEGKAAEKTPSKIRVGRIGFSHSYGSSAIAEKHSIENRRSRIFLVSFTTLFLTAASCFFAYISQGDIFAVFLINIYTLSFSITESRWSKELRYPYIYMIPESKTKKLFMLIKSDLPSLLTECVLTCAVVRIFIYCSIFEIVSMIVARFSFALMFIGINLLLQMLFADSRKKLVSATAYMLFILLFSLPSIVLGIFVYNFFPFSYSIAFITMSLTAILTATVLIYLSRGILEKIQ